MKDDGSKLTVRSNALSRKIVHRMLINSDVDLRFLLLRVGLIISLSVQFRCLSLFRLTADSIKENGDVTVFMSTFTYPAICQDSIDRICGKF